MEALVGDMGFVFDSNYRMAMNMNPAPLTVAAPVVPQAPLMVAAPPAPAVSSVSSVTAIGDWKAWDDAAFDSMNFELDLGFDTFLMATADDFMQPLGAAAATPTAPATMTAPMPTSPPVFSDAVDSSSCPSESECSVTDEDLAMMLAVVKAEAAPIPKRSRKRKNPDTIAAQKQHTLEPTATKATEKKVKLTPHQQKNKTHAPISAEADRLYRRRYDILHEILEAWNTGGIEDMEEIADDVYDNDVTLVSPDYSEGLKGVQALMHHWTLLLDSFPDGIMEEYQIERDDPEGQKMNVSWVFSGTQIFPFFGVEPRHEKVTIRGKSFFTFKGEKISQMVLSWNYREALMKLMGVCPPSDRR